MHKMPPAKLPPFSDVIKGRDVEDPINLRLHRPLAYGFVALFLRTPLTPNQITLMAMACGCAAAVLWFIGEPTLVALGGVLLWTSAILDGADGIMARAKKMQSELGRALDGSADMIVALATVIAAFYHIWDKDHAWVHLVFMPLAVLSAVIQIQLYDFYKECYLNSTDPSWDGLSFGRAEVAIRLERARAEGAPFITRFAWSSFLGMLDSQHRALRWTNPQGNREGLRYQVNGETVPLFRKHNYGPMQLWTLVSLCPHTYIMSIFALFDRLDLYLWYRVFVGNALWIAAIIWQRKATARTERELAVMGAAPVTVEPE